MPSRVCPKCGRPTNANFCTTCGVATVIPQQPAPVPAQQSVMKNPSAAVSAVFLAVGEILLLVSWLLNGLTTGQFLIGAFIVLGFGLTWIKLPSIIEYAIRKSRGEK